MIIKSMMCSIGLLFLFATTRSMSVPSTAGASGDTAGGIESLVRDLRKSLGGDEAEMDQQLTVQKSLQKMASSWTARGQAAQVEAYFPYDSEQPNVQLPFNGFAEGLDTQAHNINDAAHTITYTFQQTDFTDLHNTIMELELEVPALFPKDRVLYSGTAGQNDARYLVTKHGDVTRDEVCSSCLWWKDGGPIKLIDSVEFQWMTSNNTVAFSRTQSYGDLCVFGWQTGMASQRGWENTRREFFPMSTDRFPSHDQVEMQVVKDVEPWPGAEGATSMRVKIWIPAVSVLPAWHGMKCPYWPIACTFNVVLKLRPWLAAVMLMNPGADQVDSTNGDGKGRDLNVKVNLDLDVTTRSSMDFEGLDLTADKIMDAANLKDDRWHQPPKIVSARTFTRTIKLAGNLNKEIPMALTAPKNYYFNLDSSFPSLNPDLTDFFIGQDVDKQVMCYGLSNINFPQNVCFFLYEQERNSGESWFVRDITNINLLARHDMPVLNPNHINGIEELTVYWSTNAMESGGKLLYNWIRANDPAWRRLYDRFRQDVTRLQDGVRGVMSYKEFCKRPRFMLALNSEGLSDFNTGLASKGTLEIRIRTNNTVASPRLGFIDWVRRTTTINENLALTVSTIISTQGGVGTGLK